jgi:glycerol-3-phosphate dehydrogenase
VRYLEHGHIHLVFESSRERRRLLRIAPHLVRPLSFTWPVYRGARVAQWKLLAGLTLYDARALFRNVGNHRRLSVDGVLAREPMLSTDGLLGGAIYWDAATDDSRLTLATALGAAAAGATVLNHAAVTGLTQAQGRATGATVQEEFTGREVTLRARCVVSAVGPWTDTMHALEGGDATRAVLGSAGVHVAVRARASGIAGDTVVAPQDGRVMFVLPAGTHAIIGTTETPASRGPDAIRATREEVRYLLDACNANSPAARLGDDDVVAAWSGIRPLAATLVEESAGSASREHTVSVGPLGVLTVTGGKLTTYRAMAEDVVDQACAALGEADGTGEHIAKSSCPEAPCARWRQQRPRRAPRWTMPTWRGGWPAPTGASGATCGVSCATTTQRSRNASRSRSPTRWPRRCMPCGGRRPSRSATTCCDGPISPSRRATTASAPPHEWLAYWHRGWAGTPSARQRSCVATNGKRRASSLD